ncbi:MAG: hypothetical protein ACOYO1_16840 [Bacteroidales bacterium]
MTTTSETGHAKNVANLEELVSIVKGYGVAYNPSKASIKLIALQTLAEDAKKSLHTLNEVFPVYSLAVADREKAFSSLDTYSTRILNALKATDTPKQVIDDAKTIARKLQGKRATPKKTEEEKKIFATEGKEVIEISTSQLGFDDRLNNFDKLCKLLETISEYIPNEADLKVTAIKERYTIMSDSNTAALDAGTALSNSRLNRNIILYLPVTGMVDNAKASKKYIISLYGATSPQYKQVSKLVFRSIKL